MLHSALNSVFRRVVIALLLTGCVVALDACKSKPKPEEDATAAAAASTDAGLQTPKIEGFAHDL